MARQIAPGTPTKIEAKQFNVPKVDFSEFEKLGDAKINAANNNFKLYAESLIANESNKLYEQFKNDPIALSNALGKLPDMLIDLPEEIQDQMNKKIFFDGISLVKKAQTNQLALQDTQNKEYADSSIVASKEGMLATYANVLQNHISTADKKDPVMNEIFLRQVNNLEVLSDLKNSAGKDVYSEAQKKAIRNISDIQLEAYKQFVDRMIIEDNTDLAQTKDYYTKFMLAPERFMAENYMDRSTYDAARTYLEKQMKQAGADIKKARFNQSVRDFLDLQQADIPTKLTQIKDAGFLNKNMIKHMEDVNVKFNKLDPSKTESPIALINTLEMLRNFQFKPAPATEAEQEEVLQTGVNALDMLADYCQQEGINPKTCEIARKNIVLAETDAAFGSILNNFNDIIDNFPKKMERVRTRSVGESGLAKVYNTNWNGLSNEEEILLKRLNDTLAVSLVNMHNMLRVGDYEGLRKEQRDVQIKAAQLKYNWIENLEQAIENKDTVVQRNGYFIRPRSIEPNATCIFENCD